MNELPMVAMTLYESAMLDPNERCWRASFVQSAIDPGDWYKVLFTNPTNSGVVAIFGLFRGGTETQTSDIRLPVVINPTANLPTTALPMFNQMVRPTNSPNPVAAKVTALYQVSPTDMTGGTQIETIMYGKGGSFDLPLWTIALRPGASFGMKTQSLAWITTGLTWIERPL